MPCMDGAFIQHHAFVHDALLGMAALSTLAELCVPLVHPEHLERMSSANVRPFLSGCYLPTISGVETVDACQAEVFDCP